MVGVNSPVVAKQGVARVAWVPINLPKENRGVAALEPDLLSLSEGTADSFLG
jgi:hypothetical protein